MWLRLLFEFRRLWPSLGLNLGGSYVEQRENSRSRPIQNYINGQWVKSLR